MRDFIGDVEVLLEKIVDIPDADLASVRDKVAGALVTAREAVGSKAASIRDSTRVGADAADEYVREYPWAATGIAFALGIAVGFSTRRR